MSTQLSPLRGTLAYDATHSTTRHSVSDPYARKVYLQPLSGLPPARFSKGAQRRTAQLRRFLGELQAGAAPHLGELSNTELLIVSRRDWQKLFSYPYGLPFTRTQKGGGVSIVAAADYPPRMLRRWDDILVRAAQAGEDAPGDVREFLDLLIGHEWGHAAANLSGLRSRVKWVDEFMATYLFLAALEAAQLDTVKERFTAWARLQVAGTTVKRADLGAFEYPRGKLDFSNLLWFQGVFTLRAAELLAERGWDFPAALRGRLQGGKKLDRGEVSRLLLEVEPSFKEWFMVFGSTEESPETLSEVANAPK